MPGMTQPPVGRSNAPFLNRVYNSWPLAPEEATMPKLLYARPAQDATEERQVRKLATSRHAPADWIQRARMLVRSWDGRRPPAIAAELNGHPQPVRERITRFN